MSVAVAVVCSHFDQGNVSVQRKSGTHGWPPIMRTLDRRFKADQAIGPVLSRKEQSTGERPSWTDDCSYLIPSPCMGPSSVWTSPSHAWDCAVRVRSASCLACSHAGRPTWHVLPLGQGTMNERDLDGTFAEDEARRLSVKITEVDNDGSFRSAEKMTSEPRVSKA
jgi:hypothetical protein